jgi:hypothetical protein
MYVKVKDANFIRDTNSMALINTDRKAINDYQEKVRMAKIQKEEINNIKSEIADVRNDVQDIKMMITKLLDKNLNG